MSKKPNVIFFFSDQQRWDTLGCYGQKLNVTPNLDKMAEEGVRFEYAFTPQPVCGPARACIQTGKYATEIGCCTNGRALPLEEKTIAQYFSQAGYETAYVGKWHLASTTGEVDYTVSAVPAERRGGYKDYWMASDVLEFTSHGYDGYVFDKDMKKIEFQGYRADCITNLALDYIKNSKNDKPFFLMISHIEPHHQNDRERFEGPIGSKEKFRDYEIPGDLIGTQGDWQENYPDYLGGCSSLDKNLGRLREELDRLGLTDNTVLIYSSDHGSHFKTRNSEYKRSCHEGCIRIPMIAYGPGFKGGKVVNELVSLIDIPTTLLACAGIDKPKQMHGRALQDLVAGDIEDWRQEVFLQISESHVGRAIRTSRWKYSVCALDSDTQNGCCSDVYIEDFLYDLKNDPNEKNNLVTHPDYAQIREQLSAMLQRRIIEANEKAPKIIPRKCI